MMQHPGVNQMLDKNKTASSDRQRSAVLKLPKMRDVIEHDELVALAQFTYLRIMGEDVLMGHSLFPSQTRELTWANVRDFDRGGFTLYFKFPGDEWDRIWLDDFTPREEVTEFLHRLPLPPSDRDWFFWSEIIKRRAPTLRSYVTRRIDKGGRSSIIWKIGVTLAERGACPAEIACVLMAARCWQDKRGKDERALEREVWRMWEHGQRKIMARVPT